MNKIFISLLFLILGGVELVTAEVEERYAEITFIQGEVDVKRKGERWKMAKLRMKLTRGDKVRTRLASICELTLYDGSIVKMRENTILDVEKLIEDRKTKIRESIIKLWLGKIAVRIRKLMKRSSFEVHTPTAVIGVRGTTFLVRVDERGVTWCAFLRGEGYMRGIKQRPEEARRLRANECSTSNVEGTEITPPRSISPDELKEWEEARDFTPPEIRRVEVRGGEIEGEEINFLAEIVDDTGVFEATLFYRELETEQYKEIRMERGEEEGVFVATIMSEEVVSPGLEWYIRASDAMENLQTYGSPYSPQRIPIKEVPTIIILPYDGALLHEVVSDVRGTAPPNSWCTLKVNGKVVSSTRSDRDGNFLFPRIQLADPVPPKITYQISDYKQFINKIPEITFSFGVTPPNGRYLLEVTSKSDTRSSTSKSSIRIEVPIFLRIDEFEFTLPGPTYTYTYIPTYLKEGENEIEVVASYRGGEEASCVVSLYYDSVAPIIQNVRTELTQGFQLKILVDIFEDGAGVRCVTANGEGMMEVGEGEYMWSVDLPKERIDVIIEAEDLAGNKSRRTETYILKELLELWQIKIPPLPPQGE